MMSSEVELSDSAWAVLDRKLTEYLRSKEPAP